MITSALLAAVPGLGHAHSTREDGPVGPIDDLRAAAGRVRLVLAAGGDPAALAVPHQVHGARVAEARPGVRFPATDALVTATPGVPIFVQGADCPLVALCDETAAVVAVCHSGWRGTVQRIAGETVRAMSDLGAEPSRVVVAVFPGIGPCCFEVGDDVVSAFADAFGPAARAWFATGLAHGKHLMDVRAAIVATLTESGVRAERIDVVQACTACGGELYSHRASRGGPERHGLCVVLTR